MISELISSVDSVAGKEIVLKFWNSASGKELKITGALLALNEYLAIHSNAKKLDEKLQQNIKEVINLLYQKIGSERAAPIIEKMLLAIMNNPDKQPEYIEQLEKVTETIVLLPTEDAIKIENIFQNL